MKTMRISTTILIGIACLALVIALSVTIEAQMQQTQQTQSVIPPGSGKMIHKNAIIDCFEGKFYSMGGKDPKRTELYESKHLTFYAFGEANTTVTIQFDNSDPNCRDYSPTGQNPITGKINYVEKPWIKTTNGVKAGMEGYCYSYTITCQTPGNPAKTVDPIIDVPKKP